jgi:ribosome recycling factor
MIVDNILSDAEERMEKALGVLKNNLAGIRTGRANPGLLDSVKVTVYGSATPLKQLASVGAPEPQQLLIRPFDPSTIKDIEKAIVASELGLNPQNDGKIIRINIPPLSTDVRKKLVARIKELAEETAEKDKTISEDDRDKSKEDIQELTKKFENSVGELAKNREADVMNE